MKFTANTAVRAVVDTQLRSLLTITPETLATDACSLKPVKRFRAVDLWSIHKSRKTMTSMRRY